MSEETKVNLETQNELKLAKKSAAELRQSLDASQQERAKLSAELQAKQKLLDSIAVAAESFTLKEGKARSLVGYGVVVGVVEINPVHKQVDVMVNNERLSMYPGAIKTIESAEKTYKLVVDAVDNNELSASFTFTVVNKKGG